MAIATQVTLRNSFAGLGDAVLSLVDGVVDVIAMIPQAARVAREIERLNLLSDAELARMGLRREDIARVAFDRHLAG